MKSKRNAKILSRPGEPNWFTTYCYTEQDLDKDLARKFFPNVVSFNDLGEISFREILLGNSRFLNVPRLEELNRPIDFLKRKLIKVLGPLVEARNGTSKH